MKKQILTLLVLVSISFITYPQVQQEWVRTYQGSGIWSDAGKNICVSSEGIYVTGYSFETSSRYDIITLKYNSIGNLEWAKLFDGPYNYNDYGYQIEKDYQGNIIVLGVINENTERSDAYVLKYNTNGSLLNTMKIDSCFPASMTIDTLGNIYVTGRRYNPLQNQFIVTAKIDSSGNILWTQTFDGQPDYPDQPNSVAVDKLGNVYVGGFTQIGSLYLNSDYVLLKYTSSGVLEWIRTYNGPGNLRDKIIVVRTDLSGNIYVTGSSQSSGRFSDDFCTIKYSPDGNQLWMTKYNGPADYTDIPFDMILDSLGNSYITGYQYTNDTNSYDCVTIKYDSTGYLVWINTYNGPFNGIDDGRAIMLGNNNDVYTVGISWAGTSNNHDYLINKYSTDGQQLWTQRYGTAGNHDDICWSVAVDSSNNVYVTGEADGDITTIKYSQVIGIKQISILIPENFSLSQNYPNPFNPVTKIKFDVLTSNLTLSGAKGLIVRLAIYDILGKEVAVLVNKQLNPGTYEVEWDGSNYTSGVYFYKLITTEYSETRKMVLIK